MFDYIYFNVSIKIKYDLQSITPYMIIGPKYDLLIKHNPLGGELNDRINNYLIGLDYSIGISYDFESVIILVDWQKNINFNSLYKTNDSELRSLSNNIYLTLMIPIIK